MIIFNLTRQLYSLMPNSFARFLIAKIFVSSSPKWNWTKCRARAEFPVIDCAEQIVFLEEFVFHKNVQSYIGCGVCISFPTHISARFCLQRKTEEKENGEREGDRERGESERERPCLKFNSHIRINREWEDKVCNWDIWKEERIRQRKNANNVHGIYRNAREQLDCIRFQEKSFDNIIYLITLLIEWVLDQHKCAGCHTDSDPRGPIQWRIISIKFLEGTLFQLDQTYIRHCYDSIRG